MLKELQNKKVPIKEIKVNPKKTITIKNQLAGLCSQSPEMKYLAQKAFVCYLRSIFLQSNKDIFDVHSLPAEKFAEALGLPGAPTIKFKVFILLISKQKDQKNNSRQMEALDNKPFKTEKTIKLAGHASDSSDEEKLCKKVFNINIGN
jgi:hypothetical protein